VARIAVVGVGGIGGVFAAVLLTTGHEVLLCSRRPFARLRVESPVIPSDLVVRAYTNAREVPSDWQAAEWILVAVKAHQNHLIGAWLERLTDGATRVVALQNGLGTAPEVARAAGRAPVLHTVVYCGASSPEPGRVVHAGGLRLIAADTDTGRGLRELFTATPASVELTEDFVTAQWRKLMVNCAANGITALARRPLGVLSRPAAVAAARALLVEAQGVAAAHGASVSLADVEGILTDLVDPSAAAVEPSMLQDRLAGRPTEHGALYGAVADAAVRVGKTAPLHRLMQQLIDAGDP
jgi:2-dehydropantoate 2-reductase